MLTVGQMRKLLEGRQSDELILIRPTDLRWHTHFLGRGDLLIGEVTAECSLVGRDGESIDPQVWEISRKPITTLPARKED